jgi:hypothetical protein
LTDPRFEAVRIIAFALIWICHESGVWGYEVKAQLIFIFPISILLEAKHSNAYTSKTVKPNGGEIRGGYSS